MSERVLTLKDKFSPIKTRFIDMTDKKTWETELSFAIQHIEKNPQLKRATMESNLQAVMNVAQCGLSLNPVLKYAYMVPRSKNVNGQWIVETCLEPSYQGLCKLVTDTGSAKQIYAHVVYEGDEFETTLGTSVDIIHKPKFQSDKITHVYMVAILSDGSKAVEVMTADQINDIRARSESWKAFEAKKLKSCVWVSDYSEMARKTVVRRGIKYLPKTDMWDKLGHAISLDESDYKASPEMINRIETLLMTSLIDPEEQKYIYQEISSSISAERARELVSMLEENQVDPIDAGHNYDQGDIKNKNKH